MNRPVQALTHRAPTNKLHHYLLTLMATVLLLLGLADATLHGLGHAGSLPPPAFSNRLCADEKLRFLRDNPPDNPDLLVIGSSVAWRHFDGSTYAALHPGHGSLNGGVCGLNISQTKAMVDWLLVNLHSIRSVLMILAPPDALGCKENPAAIFDRQDATQYAFAHTWPDLFYLRYFDPISFVRNTLSINAQKANRVPLDPLVFTPTGDGPLNTNITRDTLLYDAPAHYDPACFTALHDLARQMRDRGLRLAVVLTPLSPVWKATVDADNHSRQALNQGIQQALNDTSATFWNADAEYPLPPGAFTDAIHIRWSVVSSFTKAALSHAEF